MCWFVPEGVLLIARVNVLLPRLVGGGAEQLLHRLDPGYQRDEKESLHCN